MEVKSQFHALVTLPPEQSLQYPLKMRLGGPYLGLDVWKREKNLLSLSYIQTSIPLQSRAQPSHYTNYTIPHPHGLKVMMIIYLPSCHLLAYSFVHVAP